MSTDVDHLDRVKILKQHPSLTIDNEKSRVKCSLTGHEMPATVEALNSYINGRKYKKVAEKNAFNYEENKDYLVPSNKKKHEHELFCKLTLRHIGNFPQAIQRHITGKRYCRALHRWKQCQEKGEKFVPRGGGRVKRQADSSDADSIQGGEPFWADDVDSEGDKNDNSDDMSDLIPPEDFDVSDDNSDVCPSSSDFEAESVNTSEHFNGSTNIPEKSNPSKKKRKKSGTCDKGSKGKLNHKAAGIQETDSDQEYDMSVLDRQTSSPQEALPIAETGANSDKSEKKKKKKAAFGKVSVTDPVKKKRRI